MDARRHIITEDRQMIEPKGIDAFEVADYARILFATNECWAVPAGHDARRYFVLDVSNDKQGNAAYFGALYQELDNGGREAFLHHLMHVDLTRFNVHQAPKTAALLDLKLRRLSTEDRWLLDLLHIRGTADGGDVWPARWRCSDMFDAYAIYARNAGDRHPMASSQFGEWLHKRVPGVSVGRRGSEPRHYKLPPLDECRTGFEQFIGHEIGWDSDDITDDESDWD